jgi:hypothetical protein
MLPRRFNFSQIHTAAIYYETKPLLAIFNANCGKKYPCAYLRTYESADEPVDATKMTVAKIQHIPLKRLGMLNSRLQYFGAKPLNWSNSFRSREERRRTRG